MIGLKKNKIFMNTKENSGQRSRFSLTSGGIEHIDLVLFFQILRFLFKPKMSHQYLKQKNCFEIAPFFIEL